MFVFAALWYSLHTKYGTTSVFDASSCSVFVVGLDASCLHGPGHLCVQITGLVFFADREDTLPGLVPTVILFATEFLWDLAGRKGVQVRIVLHWF